MKYLKDTYKYIPNHVIAAPLILSLIAPLIITDIWVEVYHRIAFPLYGIKIVSRRKYIKIDRVKLSYLSPVQKVYCVYCGYANGALQYWVKIVGETEAFWCGIQHKKDPNFKVPKHHESFAEYDNKEDFENKYEK